MAWTENPGLICATILPHDNAEEITYGAWSRGDEVPCGSLDLHHVSRTDQRSMMNLAEPQTPVIEPRFIEYYIVLKQLYVLHRQNGFGKHPPVPSGFSEAAGRQVRGLLECDTREYDAVDEAGLRYELKATGSASGTTTISTTAQFDWLLWIRVDFERDALLITDMPYDVFSFKTTVPRENISLGPIARENNLRPKLYPLVPPPKGFPHPS